MLRAQQHLADAAGGVAGTGRGARVLEDEGLRDGERQRAVEHARDELAEELALELGGHGLADDRTPEALHRELAEDDLARRDLERRRRHRAEDDERAVLAHDRGDVAGGLPADGLDAGDDRGAAGELADLVLPALRVGGDDAVDALLAELLDALGATDQADDVDATGLPELRDHAADGTVRGVLDDPVALVQVERVQQADGAERHRHELRRGLVGHRVRHRDEPGGVGHVVLGPDAERTAGDALADLQPVDALAERLDDTECLGAAGGRELRLEAVCAADGPQVVVVDRGEHGADEHLPGARLRDRALGHGQDVGGLTEGLVDDGAHGGGGGVGHGSVLRDDDGDVDVAARGVRVRADLVRGVREGLRLVVLHAGDDDLEHDGELEAALAVRADLHAAADGRVGDLDLLRTCDALQCGVEARGVAGGEELLGVRAVAGAAHVLRDRHVEVDATVAGGDVAVAALARGERFCGVEDVHVGSFLPSWGSVGRCRCVHRGGQALQGRDELERRAFVVQAHAGCDRRGDVRQLGTDRPPAFAEGHGDDALVGAPALAADQVCLLHPAEERGERARVELQVVAEARDGLVALDPQRDEDEVLRVRESPGLEQRAVRLRRRPGRRVEREAHHLVGHRHANSIARNRIAHNLPQRAARRLPSRGCPASARARRASSKDEYGTCAPSTSR
ncbi:hypothetical protein Cus16_3195 [Curtobacterium sp. ER1/6]|nr:hypothetical protein Cus16_3195 [Curtobacterium sp. ER1/6]